MIASDYFVTMWRVDVTVLVGAIGEIANVSQTFHPDENVFHPPKPKPSIR